MRKLVILAVGLFALSGCTSMPPLNFSVPDVGPSQNRINAELKSTTVTLGRPDEVRGDMPFGIETITPLWKESLMKSLNRMALFKDDANQYVTLSVKILAVNTKGMSVTFPTTAIARYELLDRDTGAIIYSETIEGIGETPMDYAFLGAARQRESVNRTIQNNIAQFLMALETVNVNQPLFPGR